MPHMSQQKAAPERRRKARAQVTADDRFFGFLVSNMRNGVIAYRRDGTIALMNDEAYRIFGLKKSDDDLGRPYADIFRERPAAIRVLSSAFELSHLPNRAELR